MDELTAIIRFFLALYAKKKGARIDIQPRF